MTLEERKAELVSKRDALSFIRKSIPYKGEKVMVPTRGGPLPAYIHRAKTPGKRAALFEIHGGGFVVGSALGNGALCEALRDTLDIHIISLEYRLAPEFRYPCGLEDICDFVSYFYEHADEYDIDPERLGLTGHSAGGNLCVTASLAMLAKGFCPVKYMVLDYPFLDPSTSPLNKPVIEGSVPDELALAFDDLYSEPEQRISPLISPVRASAEMVAKLPPAAFFCAENDQLYFEAADMARKMMDACVPVYFHRVKGVSHGFVEGYYDTMQRPEGETFPPYFDAILENYMSEVKCFIYSQIGY